MSKSEMSEVMKEAQSLREDFRVEHGIIRNPGKFEGEPIYVPYFWGVYMDGGADEDEGGTLKFKITAEDRKAFPELGKKQKVIRLYESENGFVSEVSRPIRRAAGDYTTYVRRSRPVKAAGKPRKCAGKPKVTGLRR